MIDAEHFLVCIGAADGRRLACTDLFAADYKGNVKLCCTQTLYLLLESRPLGRARVIGEHRFIDRVRNVKNSIVHF